MNNVLLYIGALVAMALAALFGAPHLIDWNTYRGTFEEEASRLIGREVRVAGEVNLTLLPTPAVQFGKVRIADTTGRFGEPFFRVDDFALHLNVAPLLKGIVEANQIELSRPVLRLAFDDQGRGNWLGLGPRPGASGLVPQEIALQSVRITDGMIVIHGVNGEERLGWRNINGELSAEALEGPYKFKGTYRIGDSAQDIRIATARADADGTMRLKASVDVLAAATSFELSGQVSDIASRPRIEGDLTTRIKVAGAVSTDATMPADAQGYEVKAKGRADADGFAIEDINFAFDAGGRPQLVTGGLKGTWSAPVAVKASLASRWLDVDRLLGAKADAGPGPALVGLAARVSDLVPAGIDASLDASFDQITLAGDLASGIRIGVDRQADRLSIREFRASLPGASRLDLNGVVAGLGGAEARYDGAVILRGQSLARLLAWWFRGGPQAAIVKDGPFGWISSVSATASEVNANNVTAEVGGNPLRGSAGLKFGKRPRIAVDVEAQALDLAAFPALPTGWTDILRETVANTPIARTKPPEVDLKVRAAIGRMSVGERTLHDIDAQASVEGDRLAISSLRARFDEGLTVDVSGDLHDISGRARGALAGVVLIPSPEALAATTDLLGVPQFWHPSERRAAAMTPIRLAYRAALPGALPELLAITVDGSARDTRMTIDGKISSTGGASWADAKADVTVNLSGNDARGMLALIAPQAIEFADRVGTKPARLTARGLGQLGSGAFALVTLDTDGMVGSYSGTLLDLQSGSAPRLAGELTFKGELQRALVLAGIGPRPGIGSQPVEGSARITSTDGAININAREVRIDGVLASGTATVATSSGKQHIDAKLVAEHTSVTQLLALVMEGRSTTTAASAEAAAAAALVGGTSSPGRWPDVAFDLSGLDGISGTISLNTARLSLTDAVTLRDASLDMKIGDGAIDITRIAGKAMDGDVAGTMKLQRVAGGATLTGELALTDAALGTLSAPSSNPVATGKATARLQLNARATSPRGLIASLQGKGSVDIGPTQLRRFAPKALRAAAESYLQAAPNPAASDAIRAQISESLSAAEVSIPRKRLGLTIQDGRIAIDELGLTSPEGRLAARISLDLIGFNIDCEWRIEAQAPTLPGQSTSTGLMPPVTVVYSGPLAALGTLEPQIRTDGFERELMVRRMERDVEVLERLRRLDEERAKIEADRQRRMEAAREAAISVPLPLLAPPPSAPLASPSSTTPPSAPTPPPEPAPEQTRRPEATPRPPTARPPIPAPRRRLDFPSDLGG